MWSIFGCGKKKAASNEANQWLEKNFPQQFEIIQNNYAVNTWTSLDRTKFILLLALKNDPEIQFSISWNKELSDGGNSMNTINESLNYAKTDIKNSRDLLALFKIQGVEKISVGVSQFKDAYIADVLFYANPSAKQRTEWIRLLQNSMKTWALSPKTHLWLCFMEEEYFGKDFNELIPSRYINEWHSGKKDNCIFWLEMDWNADLPVSKLASMMQANIHSQRSMTDYSKIATELASSWAKQNHKSTIYLREHGTTTQLNEKDPMAIDYCIPFFLNASSAAAEPTYDEKIDGYVCGTYQIDDRTFVKVKISKELD